MRAGRMTERVKLLSKSVTRDALGGEVITWVEEAEVWSEAMPLTGREFFAAQQAEEAADIRFRMRYRTDINATWRLEWRGLRYEIVAPPADLEARKRVTELTCRTVANI